MHTLYPPAAPGEDTVLSSELKNNFDTVRALVASNNQEELQNMATRTAIQASDEIRRLENGIAELEALLAAQQDDDDNDDGSAVVEFPSLPPVVIVQDEEESKGKQGKQPLVRG
jgi:hypothetical protein